MWDRGCPCSDHRLDGGRSYALHLPPMLRSAASVAPWLLLGSLSIGCATVPERVAAGTALGGGIATTLTGLAVGATGAGSEGHIESRASVVLLGTGTALVAAGVLFALVSDDDEDEDAEATELASEAGRPSASP